jgi:hypothetical protein
VDATISSFPDAHDNNLWNDLWHSFRSKFWKYWRYAFSQAQSSICSRYSLNEFFANIRELPSFKSQPQLAVFLFATAFISLQTCQATEYAALSAPIGFDA